MRYDLSGVRVLVVEDDVLVSAALGDMLSDFGCIVAATVDRLDEAVTLAERLEIDAAILDVNIAGELVFPVAERLARRDIPFIFASAYPRKRIALEYPKAIVLAKPYPPALLRQALSAVIASARSRRLATRGPAGGKTSSDVA
ncbi:MAG TPA: response regulator [Alphaproteobacteria bacterium]|nr:response regulator [Alphaproteobacteria bacterium]